MIRDALTRREVLARREDGARRESRTPSARPALPHHTEKQAVPAEADEPTAEVTPARRRRRSLGRLDARTRSILSAAAVAAALVNAGAVWAYWHITGSQLPRANAGTVVELNLRSRSDLNKPLTPGATGNLTVTVVNDNDFPIRITSVAAGTGNVVADDEHRENGCVSPGVRVTREVADVEWDVARNNVGAFTVPDGLTMATSSPPACAGAMFTVPVLVRGVARGSSGR